MSFFAYFLCNTIYFSKEKVCEKKKRNSDTENVKYTRSDSYLRGK